MAKEVAGTSVRASASDASLGLASRSIHGSTENRPIERLVRGLLFLAAAVSVFTTVGIVAALIVETISFFRIVPLADFFFGTQWSPLVNPQHFGVLPLVTGTLQIAIVAIFVAVPIGLASAIYLAMYAPPAVRSVVKPVLEVLAGIPSVVFGYFALTFITPEVVRRLFADAGIFNALAAGIAVGIMTIPLVSSLSEDALQAVPKSLRDGALALGATKFEVATRVMVPAAFSGIAASFILAFSRAIGETMIVTLAAGSTPRFGVDLLQSVQTMTAYMVQISLGDTGRGTIEYQTLFAVGFTLFIMTLVMNILSALLVRKFREVYE